LGGATPREFKTAAYHRYLGRYASGRQMQHWIQTTSLPLWTTQLFIRGSQHVNWLYAYRARHVAVVQINGQDAGPVEGFMAYMEGAEDYGFYSR